MLSQRPNLPRHWIRASNETEPGDALAVRSRFLDGYVPAVPGVHGNPGLPSNSSMPRSGWSMDWKTSIS